LGYGEHRNRREIEREEMWGLKLLLIGSHGQKVVNQNGFISQVERGGEVDLYLKFGDT
jgi:hypothetical protein